MKVLMLLLIGALCVAVFWKGRSARSSEAVAGTSQISETGWTTTAPPNGTDPKQVVIVAPPNCPSEAAQRAVALARQLRDRQIPCTETGSVGFTFTSKSDVERLNKVMSAPPMVFVNGKVKSNPTLEEVVAEYRDLVRK